MIAVELMMTAEADRPCASAEMAGRSSLEDGSPAAHFEFTVAITGDGGRVLTPWHLAHDASQGGAPGSCCQPLGVATIRSPARMRRSFDPRWSNLHDPVAAAETAARAESRRNPAAERDHEGKTVVGADVREVQDKKKKKKKMICQNWRHKQRVRASAMARIAEFNLPLNKRSEIGLTLHLREGSAARLQQDPPAGRGEPRHLRARPQ